MACRHDKARENNAALEVLPDLLAELDAMAPPQRLLALLQVGCDGARRYTTGLGFAAL